MRRCPAPGLDYLPHGHENAGEGRIASGAAFPFHGAALSRRNASPCPLLPPAANNAGCACPQARPGSCVLFV